MFGEWLHNLSQPELRGLFDGLDLTITYDPGRCVARMLSTFPSSSLAPHHSGKSAFLNDRRGSSHRRLGSVHAHGNAPARGCAVAGRRRGVVQPAATLLE